MIKYSLDTKKLIIRLEPGGKLAASDFEKISKKIDPLIKKYKRLKGVLLVIPSFPGWKDFEALAAHIEFVKNHHRKAAKVAVVTKDTFVKLGAREIAEYHFLHPEIKIFTAEKKATDWLLK